MTSGKAYYFLNVINIPIVMIHIYPPPPADFISIFLIKLSVSVLHAAEKVSDSNR